MKRAKVLSLVDAPALRLNEDEGVGNVLLNFFRDLGWDGESEVDPCRIRTTHAVYDGLYNFMLEKHPDTMAVGFFLINSGPGVDEDVPCNKVRLLDGWLVPASA